VSSEIIKETIQKHAAWYSEGKTSPLQDAVAVAEANISPASEDTSCTKVYPKIRGI
jgi:hypothetical protein